VAAAVRERFHLNAEMVHGRYGEFAVLVDGQNVIRVGVPSMIGILPSVETILAAVSRGLIREP
jgi:hypothetical protein